MQALVMGAKREHLESAIGDGLAGGDVRDWIAACGRAQVSYRPLTIWLS